MGSTLDRQKLSFTVKMCACKHTHTHTLYFKEYGLNENYGDVT